jgi:putative flippase GtrA
MKITMDSVLGKFFEFITNLSIFKFFDEKEPFQKITGLFKDKEKIVHLTKYLICGVLTTIFCLALFYLLLQTPLNENVSNFISIVLSIVVAYFLNSEYVFVSDEKNKFKEFLKFSAARASTFVFDMVVFFIFASLLGFNEMLVKTIIQIVVIILNYVFSKLFVFKAKDGKNTK